MITVEVDEGPVVDRSPEARRARHAKAVAYLEALKNPNHPDHYGPAHPLYKGK